MPYASDKQERLMRAVAHSPSFAKKVGIPQSVGQKFEGHKAEGGTVKKPMKAIFAGKESKAEEAAERKAVGGSKSKYAAMEKKFEGEAMKKGGAIKKYAKGGSIDGIASKGKTKGTVVKMKGGGSCM